MSWISRCCCAAVRVVAKWPVPEQFDPMATNLALAAIAVYRRTLSARTGRVCLFQPSCSERAIGALTAHGFRRGVQAACAQLDRCGGSYTLSVTTTGETWLVTSDGERFGPAEISDAILRASGRTQAHAV